MRFRRTSPRRRKELGETVEALSAKMDVKQRTKDKAAETKERVAEKATETKDSRPGQGARGPARDAR